jgi:hypothetical protein
MAEGHRDKPAKSLTYKHDIQSTERLLWIAFANFPHFLVHKSGEVGKGPSFVIYEATS